MSEWVGCSDPKLADSIQIPQSIEFAQAFCVAIPIVVIGWAVFLKVRITYGKEEVNKLTFRPIYWAIAFSLVQMLVGLLSIMTTKQLIWQALCQDKLDKPLADLWTIKIITVMNTVVLFMFLGFFDAMLNEHLVLFLFIMFQKSIPLEYLDWARDKYQRLERGFVRRNRTTKLLLFA
jgi:hypothetical protein